MSSSALIIGAGSGLSAALAKRCAEDGMRIVLAARTGERARSVADETGASLHLCDASSIDDVDRLFTAVDAEIGTPDLLSTIPRRVYPGRSPTLTRPPRVPLSR